MADVAPHDRLMRLLQEGDESVVSDIYDEHGSLAYSLALHIVHDPGSAEEIVQDVFVSMWASARRFDPDKGSLRSWLLTMVRNRAIDYIRHRNAQGGPELELGAHLPGAPENDASTYALARIQAESVRQVVAAIPKDQWLVVNLAYFGGYTHEEISRMTGMSPGTVRSQLRLGLNSFARTFGEVTA